MKRFSVLLIFIVFSPLGQVFSQDYKEIGDDLLSGLKGEQNKRIAILDFETRDPGLDRVADIFRERLTTYIVQSKKAEVIERKLLNKILEENKLEISGIINTETGSRLGSILGVSAIVTGSISSLDKNRAEINARLIRVDTARILSASNLILTLNNQGNQIIAANFKRTEYTGQAAIQIALLLDTSNSMDGLIHQAKTELWKMVNKLADAEREGKNPDIEIAIYEYGNDTLDEERHYLRQVIPFNKNLDNVSEKLFSLKTDGGDEYAGAVIQHATKKLDWSSQKGVYKAIFIAGNEAFTQGPVPFDKAIQEARKKNIFVNTIFCGPKQEGSATGWEEGASAGKGMFMNIDQEERAVAIRAPQDTKIENLGRKMNDTFIPYGEEGKAAEEVQSRADELADVEKSSGASVQRQLYKSKKQYSSSMTWDVVTLVETGKVKIKDIDKKKLPKDLQKMSDPELEKYIKDQIDKRNKIRSDIENLNKERTVYIQKEEAKLKDDSSKKSLGKAMEQAVEVQASELDYNFK